jgi:predicted metal-binding membrane protein
VPVPIDQGDKTVLKLTKRRLVVVLSALVALGIAAGAYAYFTGTGSGTSQTAAIGTSSNFNVTFGTPSGAMFPGSGSDTIPYTVTNTGSGSQQLSSVTTTVASSGANITSAGTAVAGCLATWFSASAGTVTPTTLAASGQPNDSYAGTVTVTMSDSGTNQDPCQGKTPDITVHAS